MEFTQSHLLEVDWLGLAGSAFLLMQLGGLGVLVAVGSKNFSSARYPDRFWDPASPLSNGYRTLFPWGIKRPRLKAGHSPPTSAEVKKAWIYTGTPTYAFMAFMAII
jgi:hypothetical protein